MNYDFLDNLVPQLTNVAERGEPFWSLFHFDVLRECTLGHTLGLVRTGEGFLYLNGKRHKLHPGVLFHVPAGFEMRLTTSADNMLEFYSCQFQYTHMDWNRADKCWKAQEHKAIPLPTLLFFTENRTLLDIYQRLQQLWASKEAGYVWQCKLEFHRLLDQIICMTRESSAYIQQNAALVETAIAYIRDNLGSDLDRTTLAKLLSVSPSHFAGMFKRHTGYSLSEYVHRLRMDQARFLLRSTRIPIHEIASEIGYADSFYFSRKFSQENGMSPRDYRKS